MLNNITKDYSQKCKIKKEEKIIPNPIKEKKVARELEKSSWSWKIMVTLEIKNIAGETEKEEKNITEIVNIKSIYIYNLIVLKNVKNLSLNK